ncbi:MAG: flagellar filament capping protein FliD [Neptuniibacter sp.]
MSDSIIRSLGAGSGIDTTSLVSGLVEVERAPQQQRLDSSKEKLEAQISAYGILKSSLYELQSALSPLADNDTFNARSVAFPDTDIITPNSVDPGAQTGTYQIEVEDVAQAQSIATAAYDDAEAALDESGTLTITFGTWTYDGADPDDFAVNDERSALNITVEASDSLQDIADKINDEDADVQASVLLVDGQYQMLLTAPSGADNAMRIDSDDVDGDPAVGLSIFEFNDDLADTGDLQVTETQQGQDAELVVNGLTVYRETNEVSDVIQGFNFSLNKAEPGTSLTFTVENDSAIAEQAIRDFVEAYNIFFETAENLVGFTQDEETNETVRGDLATDGSAKTLVNRLRSTIGSAIPGVTDGFTALTNVGIRTELDGSLSIDEDDFSDALTDNFELIEVLFATETRSSDDQVGVSVGSYASGTVAGDYEVVVTTDPEKAVVTGDAIVNSLINGYSSPNTVNIDADTYDFSFKVTVDGVQSDTVTLSGTYTTIEQVRADLQSLINGDSNIKDANVAVDVSFDSDNDQFVFTSRSYGDSSTVTFDANDLGTDIGEIGIVAGTNSGVDVAGTIAGDEAFGAGNVLLPPIDSDPYGLNFTIGENAVTAGSVTIGFSRGFAGEFNNLIDSFLSNSGTIQLREDNINNALDDIVEDQEDLDRKMENFELRLMAQYLAMEQIISSLQSVGDQLDGILERLPYTATNN